MNFLEELKKINVNLSDEENQQFELYYQKLIEVNQYMNLTAIVEKEEVYRKHFLDSLEILRVLNSNESITLCDVGSGAGFPSIPLAIVQSNVDVTIIDALNKRIHFLNQLVDDLNLKNVNALHFRAEDYAKEKREFFDVVTARAVARLNVLVELCLPLTKVGGKFMAMKGASGLEEIKEATKAIQTLGGKITQIEQFTLPEDEDERMIIVVEKIKPTPAKYPRNFNKIKEKPL